MSRRPLFPRSSTLRPTALLVALAALVTGCAAPIARVGQSGPEPSSVQARPDVFADGVGVGREGEGGLWLSWTLVDTVDGRRTGSANATTETTNAESTIKAWIAADHLRVAAERGRAVTPAERKLIRASVRSSDDDAAERLYRGLGGDEVLEHLREVCEVDVSTSRRGWWSFARITAVEAARILSCVVERAPSWPGGAELVEDLRNVDDEGSFGIREMLDDGALGASGDGVAEKNGWTLHSATGWNVNCVATWDRYAIAVLTRFEADRPESYGGDVCRDVTGDVLTALRS